MSTLASLRQDDAMRRLARWSAMGLLALALAAWALPHVTWNSSPSLEPLGYPEGPYLIHDLDRPLRRGDLVVVSAPERVRDRYAVLIKIVRGLPGDVVTWRGRDVHVNGEYLGTAKERSLAGEPLARGPEGIIPPGHFFLWTPHKDSYDSRYADIGWVPIERIRGRAVPLLPMRSPRQGGERT